MNPVNMRVLQHSLRQAGVVADVTAAASDAKTLYPYEVARLAIDGEVFYVRAGELANAVERLSSNPDEKWRPREIGAEEIAAIVAVESLQASLEKAEHRLRAIREAWHRRQPVDLARFCPAHYAPGESVDICYGERGEVVYFWGYRLLSDAGSRTYADPTPDVDRVNAAIDRMRPRGNTTPSPPGHRVIRGTNSLS